MSTTTEGMQAKPEQSTDERINAAIADGRGREATRLRAEQIGLREVPLTGADGKRFLYSIATALNQRSLFKSDAGGTLVELLSSHARGDIDDAARSAAISRQVAEVGHFSVNAGGIAARSGGDYFIGFETPAAREALEAAGYTEATYDTGMANVDSAPVLSVPLGNVSAINAPILDAVR